MALPQQVIDRMSQESPKTPGWSLGLLTFSVGIFILVIVIYGGLTYGYEPYIDSQISNTNTQINNLAQSISTSDQNQLITFYSEITNIQTALANHVAVSHFFTWLENHTEANVYFSAFSFSSTDQVILTGYGKTEADVNQQIAIFEAAPEVQSFTVSSLNTSPTNGLWQFNITLIMNPAAVFSASPQAATTTVTTTTAQ